MTTHNPGAARRNPSTYPHCHPYLNSRSLNTAPSSPQFGPSCDNSLPAIIGNTPDFR